MDQGHPSGDQAHQGRFIPHRPTSSLGPREGIEGHGGVVEERGGGMDLYKDLLPAVEDLSECWYISEAFSELLGKIQAAIDRMNLEGYANLEHWVAELEKLIEGKRCSTGSVRDVASKRRGDKSMKERFMEGTVTLKAIIEEIRT